MPVNEQILEECIAQATDGDKEMADFLRTKYKANDAAAVKFVGGFMTTRDYTKKSQELADQRKAFEGQSGQVENMRKALEAAESEKANILKELAGKRMSVAKAAELMRILQDKFALTDDDLPGMSDLIETRKSGKPVDSTPDLDERFKAFGDDLMKRMETQFVNRMNPELGAMAALPMIINEISREHEELTGKRLSFAEQQDLLKTARETNQPLRTAWEEKYQIAGDDGLRMKKRDERMHQQWQSDREKEDAEKRQRQALEVVTPTQADMGAGPGISAAFKTQFKTYNPDPNAASVPAKDGVPVLNVQPGQHVRQSGDRGPSAAQRAAVKYMTQVQNGGYGNGAVKKSA